MLIEDIERALTLPCRDRRFANGCAFRVTRNQQAIIGLFIRAGGGIIGGVANVERRHHDEKEQPQEDGRGEADDRLSEPKDFANAVCVDEVVSNLMRHGLSPRLANMVNGAYRKGRGRPSAVEANGRYTFASKAMF